jgi:hypothetical protein
MVEFHPLADAFPLMEGLDFDQLVADIDANGQNHPVVRFEGKILDGRNRYRACQRLGIKVKIEEFEGPDPVAFVVSENIARRHLTTAQRAIVAEKLATAMRGGYKGQKSKVSSETEARDTTVGEAAKVMDVSPQTVHRVRQTRKSGADEVVEAMDKGEITPRAASNLARLPKDKQSEIMKDTPIEDVPVVAATVTGPAGEADVTDTKGVGRGKVGPLVLMDRHMGLPDVGLVQKLADDWNEHKDLIAQLDGDKLTAFLATLKKSRTATTRLINLIEHGAAAGSPAQADKLKTSGNKGNAVTTARAAAKKTAAPKAPAKPRATAVSGTKAPAKRAPAKKTTAVPPADFKAPVVDAKAPETAPATADATAKK